MSIFRSSTNSVMYALGTLLPVITVHLCFFAGSSQHSIFILSSSVRLRKVFWNGVSMHAKKVHGMAGTSLSYHHRANILQIGGCVQPCTYRLGMIAFMHACTSCVRMKSSPSHQQVVLFSVLLQLQVFPAKEWSDDITGRNSMHGFKKWKNI